MNKINKIIFNTFNSTVNASIPALKAIRESSVPLSEDVAHFSGKFSILERNLINDVVDYGNKNGVETFRLIDSNRNEVTDLHRLEFPTMTMGGSKKGWDGIVEDLIGGQPGKAVGEFLKSRIENKRVLAMCGTLINTSLKMFGATYIHNHPGNLPLSTQDIVMGYTTGLKKIIAVTPDKKISCFTMPPFIRSVLNFKNNQAAFEKYIKVVSDKMENLKIPSDDRILEIPQEKINNLSEFCNKEIKILADKIGGHYHTEGF